jgi:hypothetical protein
LSSNGSDVADRRERGRVIDQGLADDRRGRDRLIRAADERLPDNRRRLGDTPNTPGDKKL